MKYTIPLFFQSRWIITYNGIQITLIVAINNNNEKWANSKLIRASALGLFCANIIGSSRDLIFLKVPLYCISLISYFVQ